MVNVDQCKHWAMYIQWNRQIKRTAILTAWPKHVYLNKYFTLLVNCVFPCTGDATPDVIGFPIRCQMQMGVCPSHISRYFFFEETEKIKVNVFPVSPWPDVIENTKNALGRRFIYILLSHIAAYMKKIVTCVPFNIRTRMGWVKDSRWKWQVGNMILYLLHSHALHQRKYELNGR